MRITGGQITGGVTFTSPETPTITRWVFSEDSPDFHFGVGNWDEFMPSIRSVASEGANNRLLLDINWTGSFDGDDQANAFLSGINTFYPSGIRVLSNAEALAIFQALPVGSRIDFNQNAVGNTGTIQNLTYSGNASVFPYWNTVMLSIPVEGLDPGGNINLGGIRVYHPANVYDILAVTGGD